jgi:hypothetical protein
MPAAGTARARGATRAIEPAVPVMTIEFSEELPVATELSAESVSVEVPDPPLTDGGLKLAVTPAGKPLAPRITLP